MASNSSWIWSHEHQNYYMVIPSQTTPGGYEYLWANRPRVDSITMPDPVPPEVRQAHPNLISGTPHLGWSEQLDDSYRMRSGAEIYSFFRIGKVFSMLHTQAASGQTRLGSDISTISVVRYGQSVYSQIRRFVVVEVKRGFVYACPISTYSGRGTLKPGCDPDEHSIVHFVNTAPVRLQGEYLVKEPIAITPADSSLTMHHASRLQFGKVYPIEMNVKVKDIGDVVPVDLSKLATYYAEERNRAH